MGSTAFSGAIADRMKRSMRSTDTIWALVASSWASVG
jgi:hypothetical protein